MGLALFHMGCSETVQAAEWAARAVEQRDTRMILFIGLLRASQPNMVASDPRWSSIAHTIGIPFRVHDD
jgi:hypothetical protein